MNLQTSIHRHTAPIFMQTQRARLVTTALIVGSVLLLCLMLPVLMPAPLLLVIPAAIVALVGLLILMRWPQMGLIGLMGTLVLLVHGPSGINATMVLVGGLTGLWLVEMVIRNRRLVFLRSHTLLPLALLLVVSMLALIVGQIRWFYFGQAAPLGAQLGGFLIVLLSAAAFLLVAHRVVEVKWLRWMNWIYLTLVGVYVVAYFVPGMKSQTDKLFTTPFGIANGSLFWMWGTVFLFAHAAFNQELPKLVRLMLGMLLLATIFTSFFTLRSWTSGWLPAFAGLVGVLFAAKLEWGLIASAIGGLLIVYRIQSVTNMVMIGDNQYSLMTRFDAWEIVLGMAKVNPVLGMGFANYNAYTPLFPIRGYSVNFNSHSQYVDLIAQTGVLGLICFLWFFLAVGILAWTMRTRVPPGFQRAYVYACVGGTVGTLAAAALGDWVLPFFYNVAMFGFRSSVLSWLFLGGLLALQQINRHADAASQAKEPLPAVEASETVHHISAQRAHSI